MPATVGQAAAPYPLGGDIPDGPAAFLALAQKMIDITDPVPTIADLPASGNWTGRTKTVQAYPGVEFQWNGAAWKILDVITFATVATMNTFTTTYSGVLQNGSQAYVTAVGQMKVWNGTVWTPAAKSVLAEVTVAAASPTTLTTAMADIAGAAVTATGTGAKVRVTALLTALNGGSGATRNVQFQLLCDGVLIGEASRSFPVYLVGAIYDAKEWTITVAHAPAAGSHTWKLQGLADANSACQAFQPTLIVEEYA